VNIYFLGIDSNAMAERHRDLTTPLPAELADHAPSTAVLPLGTALPHSDDSAPIFIGPAVGPGTVLRHRYVLESELGHGGMGTVYRALDRNKQGLPPQQRHVAVKVLREELARVPDALEALRREAHQAQSLSHPGIVNVFDFDRDGEIYFITMELLEGELLSDLIRRLRPGKLSREAATGILRALARRAPHGSQARQRDDHDAGRSARAGSRPGASAHDGAVDIRSPAPVSCSHPDVCELRAT
jgi:hypothetical protein